MKHTTTLLLLFAFTFHLHLLHAALPRSWTVDVEFAKVQQYDVYRGETLDLEANLMYKGRPFDVVGPVALSWQTNGMGNLWWSTPAAASGNVIRATWTPAHDCGAAVYNAFLGAPSGGNYRPAVRLRMLHAPGAHPNTLELPVRTLDFATIEVLNAPWGDRGEIPEIITNTVTKSFVERLGIEAGAEGKMDKFEVGDGLSMSTNWYCWVVTNAVRNGSEALDGNGKTYNGNIYWTRSDANGSPAYRAKDETPGAGFGWGHPTLVYHDGKPQISPITSVEMGPANWAWVKPGTTDRTLSVDPSLAEDIEGVSDRVDSLEGAVSSIQGDYASKKSVEDVGKAVGEVQQTVSAWQTYWDGDDVRVTVTNYYGSVDIPSLYLEQKMQADEEHEAGWFKVVWDERTRWNLFMPDFEALCREVNYNKADRAWGVYDSSTGAYSPDGLLQLSQEQIMIASGMSYQKTVTTGGNAVWVLKATDPTMLSGVVTNGYFRIQDGDGNPLFEIVKGGFAPVGATATSISMGNGGMTIGYNVRSDAHPTISCCTDLGLEDWATEDETGAVGDLATVSWGGESGAWVATVAINGPRPTLFATAKVMVGGNTYIRNNVATSIDKVVVGGVEYTVSVETVNGKKLLVLK